MDKEKANQMANKMSELCQNSARSAILFAGSPTGKALYLVVMTVLFEISPTGGDIRFWMKPPISTT
jgi:hypothetical protein